MQFHNRPDVISRPKILSAITYCFFRCCDIGNSQVSRFDRETLSKNNNNYQGSTGVLKCISMPDSNAQTSAVSRRLFRVTSTMSGIYYAALRVVRVPAYYFHANVRVTSQQILADIQKYVVSWLEHSCESNRQVPDTGINRRLNLRLQCVQKS